MTDEDLVLLFYSSASRGTAGDHIEVAVNRYVVSRASGFIGNLLRLDRPTTFDRVGRPVYPIMIAELADNNITADSVRGFFTIMNDMCMRSLSDSCFSDVHARAAYRTHKRVVRYARSDILRMHLLSLVLQCTRIRRWLEHQILAVIGEDTLQLVLDYVLMADPHEPGRYHVRDECQIIYQFALMWIHCMRSPALSPIDGCALLSQQVHRHRELNIFESRSEAAPGGAVHLAGTLAKCIKCRDTALARPSTGQTHFFHLECTPFEMAVDRGMWAVFMAEDADASGDRSLILHHVPAPTVRRFVAPDGPSEGATGVPTPQMLERLFAMAINEPGTSDAQYDVTARVCAVKRATRAVETFAAMTATVPAFALSSERCAMKRNKRPSALWRARIALAPHCALLDYYEGHCRWCGQDNKNLGLTAYALDIVPTSLPVSAGARDDPMDLVAEADACADTDQ